jgi:hypothetical protein
VKNGFFSSKEVDVRELKYSSLSQKVYASHTSIGLTKRFGEFGRKLAGFERNPVENTTKSLEGTG